MVLSLPLQPVFPDSTLDRRIGRIPKKHLFNFRIGRLHAAAFLVSSVKLPNLQLKTRPKQLLGSLPLVIELPGACPSPSLDRVLPLKS
jgi:hypothetical protein